MKENYFSAATVVAYTADANFDGTITYNAPDDGIPDLTKGVEVWAAGQRNPFGITLHSNGFIYGTDNGPNLGYVSAFPQWVLLRTTVTGCRWTSNSHTYWYSYLCFFFYRET